MGDHVVEFAGDPQPLGRERLRCGVGPQGFAVRAALAHVHAGGPGQQDEQGQTGRQAEEARGEHAGPSAVPEKVHLKNGLLDGEGGEGRRAPGARGPGGRDGGDQQGGRGVQGPDLLGAYPEGGCRGGLGQQERQYRDGPTSGPRERCGRHQRHAGQGRALAVGVAAGQGPAAQRRVQEQRRGRDHAARRCRPRVA
ncbi:hypothetical protein [Streptomyces wedmorensis]